VGAEYFTGPDPGEGNATPLTTTALSSISSLFDEASLSLSALGTGVHSIQLRVQDGAGQWSNTLIKRIRLFDPDQVTGTADAVAAAGDIQSGGPTVTTIAAAEYFTGPDPGKGNATPLTTTALSSISSLFDEASLSLSTLGIGTHSIQIRVQDGAGQWSNTLIKRIRLFDAQQVTTTADAIASERDLQSGGPAVTTISAAEYFTGPDPGEGNATSLDTTTLSSISALFDEATLSLSSLGAGTHSIQLRVQDGAGRWSGTLIKRIRLFNAQQVTTTAAAVAAERDVLNGGPTVTAISAAEYFTGPDPGEGNATPLTTTFLSSISSLFDEASLSLSVLGAGTHSIKLRVRDGAGQWSNTLIKRVEIYGGQTFDLWQADVFTAKELLNPAISDAGSDFDGDGLSNFLEYGLNTNPRSFETGPHVPIVTEVNGRLAITFERWKGATDISYTVEMSSDLHIWTEVQTVENVLDNGDGTQTVTISDDLPLLGMPRRFVRIAISSL